MFRFKPHRAALRWLTGLLALAPLACPAQQKFVFVIDEKPPEVVFTDGLLSPGDNRDLDDFLGDEDDDDSAFIPGTASVGAARWIADTFIAGNPGADRVFIYQVRADDNFYSLNLSVQFEWENVRRARIYRGGRLYLEWLGEHDWMRSYITDRSIAAGMIVSAAEISRNPGSGAATTMHAPVSNRQYIETDTHASTEPYGLDEERRPDDPPSPYTYCRPPKPFIHREDDDHEGAIGIICGGDVLAAASPHGYVPLRFFPACMAARSKRSAAQRRCLPFPMTNLSKRGRAVLAMVLNGDL